jgi:hypothetical protein
MMGKRTEHGKFYEPQELDLIAQRLEANSVSSTISYFKNGKFVYCFDKTELKSLFEMWQRLSDKYV